MAIAPTPDASRRPTPGPAGAEPRPSWLAPVALSVALAAALVLGGLVALERFVGELRAEEDEELVAVASMRAGQVAGWRQETLDDAATLATLVDLGAALGAGPADAAAHRSLPARLAGVLERRQDLSAIALLDGTRRVHLAVGRPATDFEGPVLEALLDEAARRRGPAMSNPQRATPGAPTWIDVATLLPARPGEAAGVLVLRYDPARVLFGDLLAWPIPSHRARTLLVRPVGDRLEVLGGSGPGLPAPLTTLSLAGDDPLARAMRGERGDGAWLWPGGRDVLTAAVPVPGTDWRLVAEQDFASSMSPLRTQAVALGVALGAALAVVVALGWLWWRLQLARWERRRERALAERAALQDRLDLLSRHANDMMILADGQQVVVDVNDRACEALGYAREELVGRTLRELRDPTTLAEQPLLTADQLEQGGAVFETRYRRQDGSTFPVEVSIRIAPFGGQRFVQGIVRDITERRRLELELQLADRMASVGSLAAGVAHEVNNPLAYVLANLDFALADLAREKPDMPEVRHALVEAREGAVRVRQVVRDLKTFSHGDEADRRPVDVRRVLQTAVGMAQNEIRQRARLSLELADIPPVLGSEHRLGQAFLNLLVNAAQAINPGAPERNLVNASTALAEDGRVMVEIADTGGGIPAEALPRIFDPFFTTRPVGSGIGLGLSIVHAIVTDLGGEVRVRSEPGQGSIFTVLLPPTQAVQASTPPAAPATAPAAAPSAPAAAPFAVPATTPRPSTTPRPAATPVPLPAPLAAPVPAGGPAVGRVLVVDDEPLVGKAVTRILAPPHQVTLASSATDALRLLQAGPYDVVLCDLMMPGMTGMELHARLVASDPAMADRMIFLSGGAYTETARTFLERVPNARMDKPFEPATLREVVAGAVAAARAGAGG
ncbi:MAG: PAS domain S-box protein [Anaeromyxobacter sp.]|nr:PAS domain S-box protein [Anaeromyxobacter sp.]MBL0276910.1 PAS domain S-box protein [Anaeromyxobacter sp.]